MVDRNKKAREVLKQKHKKRILIYGPACNNSTGLGKIIFYMAKTFQEAGHEVFTVAQWWNKHQIFYKGVPIIPDFFCEQCGGSSVGSTEYISKFVEFINLLNPKPDYLICVGDPFQFHQYGIGNIEFKDIKTLIYTTMDSNGYFCNGVVSAQGKKDYMMECDRIISMAEFTKDQLKEWTGKDSTVIYPPILTDLYKPVSDKEKINIRKEFRIKPEEYIMYFSGRNILRKRYHTMLMAAGKFITQTKNTKLLLNIPYSKTNNQLFYPDVLNPVDFIKRVMKKELGRDLLEEGRIFFVEREELGSTKISEEENVKFYQVADLYISSTGGEGFGFCPVEANACGVPFILPNNSTGIELIDNEGIKSQSENKFIIALNGILVDASQKVYSDFNTSQMLCNEEDFLDAIRYAYSNQDVSKEMGKRGIDFVKGKFNLDNFKKQWIEVIRTTEKKPVEETPKFNTLELDVKEDKNGKEKRKD